MSGLNNTDNDNNNRTTVTAPIETIPMIPSMHLEKCVRVTSHVAYCDFQFPNPVSGAICEVKTLLFGNVMQMKIALLFRLDVDVHHRLVLRSSPPPNTHIHCVRYDIPGPNARVFSNEIGLCNDPFLGIRLSFLTTNRLICDYAHCPRNKTAFHYENNNIATIRVVFTHYKIEPDLC